MLRVLLAAILAVLGAPVLAQDEVPTVNLFALAFVGFADGATVEFGGALGQPRLREVKAGVFQLVGADKKRALFTFTEPEDCVVEAIAKLDPPQDSSLRVDIRALTAITIEPHPPKGDLPGWEITADATEGGIVTTDDGTARPQSDLETVIYTTVPREEMEAAAAALIARCTKTEVVLADASPVDLLALIFAGVAEGSSADLSGVQGIATKEFDGLYSIKPLTGDTEMRLAIRQQGRCEFLFVAGEVGDQEFSAKLDANLISAITVEPDGERDGFAAYRVTVEGDDGRLMIQNEDGWEAPENPSSYLTTSVPMDRIEAAIEAFRTEYCPGLAAAVPAVATDTPAVDLVPAILLGVSDGSRVILVGDVAATATQTGPGTFEVIPAMGAPAGLAVTETAPCVFDIAVTMDGALAGTARFDANKLRALTYSGSEPGDDGLVSFSMALDADPGLVMTIQPDGTATESGDPPAFKSTMTLDELNAAVAAFQEFCPAKGG